MTVHNGCIKVENVITTEDRLSSALTSLQDTLFRDDSTGFNFFYAVITQIFKFGMVNISHMNTGSKQTGMELACKCCYRYVCMEVNWKWDGFTELQKARATLLSFISGCQYTRPGSDDLPQR